MKRFIGKLLFLLFPVLLVVVLMPNRKIIPFTSSISLDSKIYELKRRDFDTISTIAVGSSMTLNNLNSDAWVRATGDSSFYNISSWGQSILEDCQIIRAIVPLYHPSRVVIFAHCTDFNESEIDNIPQIEAYLRNSYHFGKFYFDALSIYSNTNQLYSDARKDTLEYTSLNYDPFGGVALNVSGSHIDENRWNSITNFVFSPDNKCYSALSELCSYLKEQNIRFVLVNTPARAHYFGDGIEDAYKHIHHCDSIISACGQIFIDELDFLEYPDSLFADCSHLNSYGAAKLTRNVCSKLSDKFPF